MAKNIKVATNANFSELIKEGYVFVDFWAEWCGPCKMIGPVVEELATEWEGKITFAKLNTDEHPETAQKYGIQGIPTLILFKDGQITDRIVGARTKEMFNDFLNQNYSK